MKAASGLMEIGENSAVIGWLEEYLTGSDLRSLPAPWEYEDLLRMALHVGSGLGALHLEKVIHRDLSPGNVQKRDNGAFVVIDPGVAKHTLRTGITVGGQPGTRGYMTPEHIQSYSGAPTAASDVFGCGALVYAAATGSPPVPYKGDDGEYIQRLRNAQHEELAALRPDLPTAFVEVIERCLHRQPARRYRSGNDLRAALEAIS